MFFQNNLSLIVNSVCVFVSQVYKNFILFSFLRVYQNIRIPLFHIVIFHIRNFCVFKFDDGQNYQNVCFLFFNIKK